MLKRCGFAQVVWGQGRLPDGFVCSLLGSNRNRAFAGSIPFSCACTLDLCNLACCEEPAARLRTSPSIPKCRKLLSFHPLLPSLFPNRLSIASVQETVVQGTIDTETPSSSWSSAHQRVVRLVVALYRELPLLDSCHFCHDLLAC